MSYSWSSPLLGRTTFFTWPTLSGICGLNCDYILSPYSGPDSDDKTWAISRVWKPLVSGP